LRWLWNNGWRRHPCRRTRPLPRLL
jgi:hypothetical protein